MVTDSAHLDKVAKAMWDTHAFPEWDEISSDDRDLYRALAQAALEALQLTEEEQDVYDHAEPYSTAYEHRLVGPWVRVDGGDA